MKLGEKTRTMSKTIKVGLVFLLFMLILQAVSFAYFTATNREQLLSQQAQTLARFGDTVREYYADVDQAIRQLSVHPAAVELKYRETISYRNFEKLHRIINQLKDMRAANGGRIDPYLYFTRSGALYGGSGLATGNALMQTLEAIVPTLAPGETRFVTNVSVESGESAYQANLRLCESDGMVIVVACPVSVFNAACDLALHGGAQAVATDAQGQFLAWSSAAGEVAASGAQDTLAALAEALPGYAFAWQETGGLRVCIGYDRNAPLLLSARSNTYLALSTMVFLLFVGLFLWLFIREIYTPVKRILGKLGVGEARAAGDEYARIDAYVSGMSARVSALSHQVSEYKDIVFQNTLNKLALQIKGDDADLRVARGASYLVMTVACEADDGTINAQDVGLLEQAVSADWRIHHFYRYGKQLSYHVAIAPGDLDAFMARLRGLALDGYAAFGLSSHKAELSQLRQALEESRTALLQMRDPQALQARSVCLYSAQESGACIPALNVQAETCLINSLLGGDAEAVKRRLLAILPEDNALPVLQHRELCLYLLNLLNVYRRDGLTEQAAQAQAQVREAFSPSLINRTVFAQYQGAAQEASQENQTLGVITGYIRRNFAHSDLSLQSVADYVGMSYAYVSKYLKQAAGISFTDYVAHVRIDGAKALLRSSDLPIRDIAAQVGFDVFSSFSRAFKKYEGISPGEYRKLYGRQKDERQLPGHPETAVL